MKIKMRTNKIVLLGVILAVIPVIVFAQSGTNSPYTRYGYGVLADKAFISQRGMGGIGYGLRNSQMINPMNPASFSSVDSMTFMFDLGLTTQMSWFSDALNSERKINGNLEYVALQFPITRKLGIGAGFEPISYVGYNYADTAHLPIDQSLVQYIYTGQGGLSRVYADLSYDFLNSLSIGVKLSYLFGDITHNKLVTFNTSNSYNTTWADTIRAYGFLYDFGLQYHRKLGKFSSITVGAIYSPKIRFGAKVMTGIFRSNASGVIMDSNNTTTVDSVFQFPETYGLGFTYNQLGKFTVGADASYEKWADAKFYDQTNALNNRLKLNVGGEIIPNRTANGLLKKMRYRAGLQYTNSYIKVNDSRYNEYGLDLGFGLPMPDRRSLLNLAFEYSLIRPELNTLIDEQYFKVSVSYTFNELWFFKRKVQ